MEASDRTEHMKSFSPVTESCVDASSDDNSNYLSVNWGKRKSKNRAAPDMRRRKSNFNMSFNAVVDSDEYHFCSKLYHTKRKVFPLKDYHDEARAMRDLQKFLEQPIVLFKVHHTSWENIIKEMIITLSAEKPELKLDVNRCIKSLISRDADYVIPECIQGIRETGSGSVTDQTFVTAVGTTTAVNDSQVVMALLEKPFNFGVGAEEIRFICIVLTPPKKKHTKSGLEIGRTYSTLLADDRLRHNLINTHTPAEFAHEFEMEVHRIHKEHEKRERETKMDTSRSSGSGKPYRCIPGRLLVKDIKRRAKFYLADYVEDLNNCTSIQKMFSATLFLYFSLLLPGIAFGVLHDYYTERKMDSKNVIVSQAMAGVLFSIFGGQPLVVVRTTIPVVIYTKIIYQISLSWAADGSFFYTLYSMVGLSNSFFLILYSLVGASNIMMYCSRSTEEIVGLFISVAFVVDSVKYIVKEFNSYYCFANLHNVTSMLNTTANTSIAKRAVEEFNLADCDPTKPMLAILLMLITVYLGVQIFNFKYSPYLNADKRVIVADYALVVAVISASVLGSYIFKSINLKQFTVNDEAPLFRFVDYKSPPPMAVVTSVGLGFLMSFLFFMEGNISASVVNNPQNKLKKGSAFHLDMFVTGAINAILSLFALPWVHGSLPHSPLHVRALADIEEHVENGHLTETIVYVRETRLTTFFSNVMIGLSLFMFPYPLNLIPIPVLYGLFLFLAVTSLGEFQMWERFVLIFTEQNLYPPIHYVRRVPQKIIHCFTLIQLIQLFGLCMVSFGGSAYLKMFFPFCIIMLLPIREKILPKMISDRYLEALDGEH